MDQTTVQVFSVLFVMATVVLLYTARFFERRRRQRAQRQMAALERLPAWTSQSIESSRPLHLSLGASAVGGEDTPSALAGAEFFYHLIQSGAAGDQAPTISTSSPTSVPLAQDTARRAWEGDSLLSARWYPPGLAFAGGLSAAMAEDEAAAQILAGKLGPELALILDGADRGGSLAVSDQLEGQAVAFAMADETLIGEELYAAAGYVSDEASASRVAVVIDVWRGLLIIGLTLALLLAYAGILPWLSWQLLLAAVVAATVLGLILARRS